jgi:uncharacterized protein (DUF362 family)
MPEQMIFSMPVIGHNLLPYQRPPVHYRDASFIRVLSECEGRVLMRRRAFLKVLAAMAMCFRRGGTVASPAPSGSRPPAPVQPGRVSLAGIERGSSPQVLKTAVRAAAEAATDFSWLSRGDAVFIKPALNSGNPYPATTSGDAIAAVVGILKEKGAGRVIVGDMCGIEHVKLSPKGLRGSSRSLMEASGMAQAARSAGAEINFFEESGWDGFYEDFPAAGSSWKRGLMMPKILKEVDHIILMPRCGRHPLAGSTLGLKAAVGYWRTDTRGRQWDAGKKIRNIFRDARAK